MSRKLLTLVFIQKCNQILLGYKKRGFGASKWNGFGGKVNFNESITDAAVRSVKSFLHFQLLIYSVCVCDFLKTVNL